MPITAHYLGKDFTGLQSAQQGQGSGLRVGVRQICQAALDLVVLDLDLSLVTLTAAWWLEL